MNENKKRKISKIKSKNQFPKDKHGWDGIYVYIYIYIYLCLHQIYVDIQHLIEMG